MKTVDPVTFEEGNQLRLPLLALMEEPGRSHEPEPVRYFVESFVPADDPRPWWLERYLLELCQAHEWTVLGSVEWDHPEPEVIPWPRGIVLARPSVLVREWDVEV